MGRQIKFKSGNTQVNMSDDVIKGFENIVKKMLPETKKAIDQILDKLENDARQRWLVREENSKGSREKIYSEIVITPNLELVAHLGNSAEYAWAIKVGVDPQNSRLNMDRRLADGLLWAPAKKASNKIAKIFADEVAKQMKRG